MVTQYKDFRCILKFSFMILKEGKETNQIKEYLVVVFS